MIETLTHTLDILLLAGANVMAFAFFVGFTAVIFSFFVLAFRKALSLFNGEQND